MTTPQTQDGKLDNEEYVQIESDDGIKPLLCQRCGKETILEMLMGVACSRKSWQLHYNDKSSAPEGASKHRFFSMERKSPFAALEKGHDAQICICLSCGQTQGIFPTSSPFECLQITKTKLNHKDPEVLKTNTTNQQLVPKPENEKTKHDASQCLCTICDNTKVMSTRMSSLNLAHDANNFQNDNMSLDVLGDSNFLFSSKLKKQ
jgi:hypothetical protein